LAPVAKAVNRWLSTSVNRSCTQGCGRSFRMMARIPVGQEERPRRPVLSAIQALSMAWPFPS
jgi:hypothetical protein